MRERFFPISIMISAGLILIGLLFLSSAIKNRPVASTPDIPSSIAVQTEQAHDYMEYWEAQSYLRMEESIFKQLITSGALKGTYISYEVNKYVPHAVEGVDEDAILAEEINPYDTDSFETVTGTMYIFSKAKLDEWIAKRFESQEPLN